MAIKVTRENMGVVFSPRDEVLEWASRTAASPAYRDWKVIFLTHAYMKERTAERIIDDAYDITPRNGGESIWRKLIEPASNIRLVLCGHTHDGQLWPANWLMHLLWHNPGGIRRHGRGWLVTTSGAGAWGPPMRVGTCSEVLVLDVAFGPCPETENPLQ